MSSRTLLRRSPGTSVTRAHACNGKSIFGNSEKVRSSACQVVLPWVTETGFSMQSCRSFVFTVGLPS